MESREHQIVKRAQRGDMAAFGELVERHRRTAFAVAYARLGNAEDARDVVQEAFVEAFLGLPGLQEAAKFRAWLTTILIRRCAVVLKARRKQADLLSRVEEQLPVLHDTGNPLAGVLDRLSPGDRDLLTLSVLDGYSYAEIAARLGLTVSAVRSRIHRARLRLYQEVFPMADAATVRITRDIMERVLLRLTSVEQSISSDELKDTAERVGDAEFSAITNGLAWLMEHGESLERAFLLTGALPPGLCSLIRLGRETERGAMMFRTAAGLLKVGLLQPDAPVTPADAANFFAYFSCILQAGIPVIQAMTKAGERVPSLAAVATDIVNAWRSRQSWDDVLRQHGHIFTEPCVSLLSFGINTGRLEHICALLATFLWEPAMLEFSTTENTWEERLRRAEEVMRLQGRFKA